MEQRVTQHDVTINGQQYRVIKMDARSACWLFSVIAHNVTEDKPIGASLGKLSLEEFMRVQTHVLRYAYTLDNKDGNVFPTAVLASDGSWADKILGDNPLAIQELTLEALMFNLNPFLAVRASSSSAQTEQDSPPQTIRL